MNEDHGEKIIPYFEEAMSLIDRDQIKDALEICGKMRLNHDLFGMGQTTRTITNLLIIMLSVPGGYERTKFAEGAILLIQDDQINLQMEEQATKILVERLPEKFTRT